MESRLLGGRSLIDEDGAKELRVEKSARRGAIVLTMERETSEIEALVDAAGLQLVEIVRQQRARPDPATFLGRGKLEEIKQTLHLEGPPLAAPGSPVAVVNGDLRPPALFNMVDALGVEVWDRTRLILEIFQRNARVKEAQLQVELARLRYELPFVHEALHRQLTGERAGFMGGGELEARTYETHLKRRTKNIVEELERIKKERRTRRAGRRRTGLRLISITGYTNSGKSSLLNTLTGSETVAEHRVFSTLQTATRRLKTTYSRGKPSDLLLTDTVGFIRDLPPWLIDAFSSTLEETAAADALLLVVDASETPTLVEEKLATAQDILERIHAPRRRLILLNKADLLDEEGRSRLYQHIHQIVRSGTPIQFISTQTGEGLQITMDLLRQRVLDAREVRLILDVTRPQHLQFEAWLRDHTEFLDSQDEKTQRSIRVRSPLGFWGQLLHEAKKAGIRLQTPSTGNHGGAPGL